MPKTSSKPVDADENARMADEGQDISAHLTNRFTVVRPAVRVNNPSPYRGVPGVPCGGLTDSGGATICVFWNEFKSQ